MLSNDFTLDPRFEHAWCKSHEAVRTKSYLLMEAATMSADETERTSSTSGSEPPSVVVETTCFETKTETG